MVHAWTGATPDSIKVRTALPTGLTAHPATGTISGTATVSAVKFAILVVGYACNDSSLIWDTLRVLRAPLAYAGNPLSVSVGSAIANQDPTSVAETDSITGTVPHGLTLTKTGATMGRIAGTPDTIGAFTPWLYSWYANAKADSVRFTFSIRDTVAVPTASGGLPYRSAAYRTEYRGRAYRGSVFR
jgi:hypothetical protein